MRLWHINILPYLQKQHLVAQWRELSAIAGAIQKNGTPNHLLVNFVLDYDYDHFISYTSYLREIMNKKGIKTMNQVWDKITSLKSDYKLLPIEQIYKEKMNPTYYRICYYNIMEKYLCGMYTKEEFDKIPMIEIN